MLSRFAWLVLFGLTAVGAEEPLAVITQSHGAVVARAGVALALPARPGDLLYWGDRISGGRVELLACRSDLAWGREVVVESPPACVLPPIPRTAVPAPLIFARDQGGDGALPALSWKEASPGRRLIEAEFAARSDPAAGIQRYEALARLHPEFRELAAQRILLLEEDERRRRPKINEELLPGRVLALLVGISEFENAQIRPLRYAHEDAYAFEQFLRSPRGGGAAEDAIVVLTNRQATTAAIRAALESLARRATPADTVVILFATHGAVVENGRNQPRGAFLVTYDSDPENLAATALPMATLQHVLRVELARAGRVLAFLDACRAGTIGTIPDRSKLKIVSVLDSLTETEGQLLLFSASRPGEVSYEGRQYGGGHGAFTFFTLEALNGAADLDANAKVTVSEMISYVQQRVAEATADKQHPREGGTLDTTLAVADLALPGIALGAFDQTPPDQALPEHRSRSAAAGRPVRTVTFRQAIDFEEALASGNLLPDAPGNAFTAFRQLKQSRRFNQAQLLEAQTRLLVALEQQHQQVVLRYLRGEALPPRREDFDRASRAVHAAMLLFGETPLLLSRALFHDGRLAILDRRYAAARGYLESALRLDPQGAHLWNALGTALLEEGRAEEAAGALLTAIDLAPNWIYPRNSLALAFLAVGDYWRAEKALQAAIRLDASRPYLRVNLGFLYQKQGRWDEAESAYREALARDERLGEAWNGLGAVAMARRRHRSAEECFRRALAINPDFGEARENLARLIEQDPSRRGEALELRRENATRLPDFLPSRIALARALAGEAAAAEWQSILGRAPGFAPARLALARCLLFAGRALEASRQLSLLDTAEASLEFWELRGDVERALGNQRAAEQFFSRAAELAWQREDRKRLRAKMQVSP